LAFVVAGIKPGDEVIVPTLTFAATANAVVHAGAVPHFADSDETTLGLDPKKLDHHLALIGERREKALYNRETGRRIAAIVPMHTFGNPVDMDALQKVADKYDLPIIEDATESLGSTYKGKPCGSFGLMSTLSFNGNKIITTGGGGAILTNDAKLAQRAKHLSTTAKKRHAWDFDHDEVAWNYRLPNINAALGVAQLEQLPGFLTAKRKLAITWQAAFSDFVGARMFSPPAFADSNHWLAVLILEKEHEARRDDVLRISNETGLMTRPLWKLMHHLGHFSSCPRMDLTTAEKLERRIVNIPSSVKLAGAGH
jgi:perosamine synthetase